MAEHGVLQIPPDMIDPKNRNVMALVSRFEVVAYNKNLVSPGQLPKTWEDILKPEWKGRKFGTDIRPQELAALVPAWGLDKTVDYALKIAAQQPVWARGGSRPLAALAAGEIPLYVFGANYGTVTRAQRKDPLRVIQLTHFGAGASSNWRRASDTGDISKSSRSASLAGVSSRRGSTKTNGPA